jgi:hypothetical protein
MTISTSAALTAATSIEHAVDADETRQLRNREDAGLAVPSSTQGKPMCGM